MTVPDPTAGAVFSIAGKTALVTGASSGLGAHFARTLAAHGANVVLAARRLERLRELAEEIDAGPGGRACTVALDVTSAASVANAMAVGVSAFGGLDILVNNAGIGEGGLLLDTTDAEWRRIMDVNLDGAFRVARDAAAAMKDGGGAIVNIASVLSFEVQPGSGAYAAAKAGVAQMIRAMALEFARHKIRVNAIAPGYFHSEMTEAYFATDAGRAMLGALPHGRPGDPHELDGALLLLASDAGAYLTGTTVMVDGGHSLLMP